MFVINKSTLYSYIIGILVSFFLFSGYFETLFFSGNGGSDYYVYITCLLFMFLMALESKVNFIFYFLSLFFIILFFIFLEFISVQFRTFNYYDFNKIRVLLLILFISIYISSYYSKNINRLNELSKCLSHFAFIIAIMMFLTFRGNADVQRLGQDGANPIWIARLSGIPIIYSFIALYSKRGNPIYYAAMFTISMFIMILASSRGPLLSLIISISVYILFVNEKLTSKIIKYIKYIFIFSIVLVFMPTSFTDRFTRLFSGNFDSNDLSRFELIDLSIELFVEQPLGRGIGAFSLYSYFPYPHNFLMEIAVELGVFVLIFTLMFFSYSLYKGITGINRKKLLGFQFIVLLMVFSFVNSLFSGDITSPKDFYISLFIVFLYYARINFGNTVK